MLKTSEPGAPGSSAHLASAGEGDVIDGVGGISEFEKRSNGKNYWKIVKSKFFVKLNYDSLKFT